MKKDPKQTIGVLVLTKNEEAQLAQCLQQFQFADEIIVVDSESTDRTRDLAAHYTDKIFIKPMTDFRTQRLFGIEQIRSEWLLMVDADERLSEGLIKEIQNTVKDPEVDALEIPRRNYVLGEWVRYGGWYPDHQTRLIRKSTLKVLPELVHKKFDTTGNKYRIPETSDSYFIHYTCDSITRDLEKINQYTTLDAQFHFQLNDLKISRGAIFSRSLGMMTQSLFDGRGIRVGMRGFIIAGFAFIYSFLMMVKIWELQKDQKK